VLGISLLSVSIGDQLKCINGNIRIIGSMQESKIPHLSRLNMSARDAALELDKSAKELLEYIAKAKMDNTNEIPSLLQIRVMLFVFIIMGCKIKYIWNSKLPVVR
jgi:hypothetical protein